MIGRILTALVGILHVYFGVSEIFLWNDFATDLLGPQSEKFFEHTSAMAANQGVYNFFLAAGLLLAAIGAFGTASKQVALYFLLCVIVAGVFGFYSFNFERHAFLLFQALPGLVALVATLFLWKRKA